ncbi:acyl-CoA synthetase [Thermicanus aegyptius]|uniref:acyl-CoA synthetase n=1 Tax=Thermicanus aegyptius TaxID=94009 RepID=UPI00041EBA1D|nr:long-chain fatty acid--CoA ligase [Thermicanus aegyptius]
MDWERRWFERRAALTPNRIALVDGESKEEVTYEGLYRRANEAAFRLIQFGIEKGDRIAILTPNEIPYFEVLFATYLIGAIFIPLNYRLSVHELTYILQDSGAKVLFYHPSFEDQIDLLREEIPSIQMISTHGIFFQSKETIANKISPEGAAGDPWVMLYTGGTTGRPKGVVLTYRNILWNAINTVVSWGLSPRDITYTVMPLFHTGGLNALTLPVLYAGGKVIVGKQFKPYETIQTVEREKVTILLLVPTMHLQVLQEPALQHADFSHDPIFLSGGAPCPLSIYDGYQKRGIRFKEGYGLTEAGPNNFYLSPDEAFQKKGSVGKPMIHNGITLVDEHGKEVPSGEVGELVIEGPHVFFCYWNNQEETEKVIRDGKLYTGDLGRRDEEGYYYIVGRKKEMFISGGENIYPLEIENVLQNHPSLAEAVVIGVPDDKWGEKGIAFLVAKNGEELSKEELKEYCSRYLARFKIPKEFIFLDQLPKTGVGKIDKKELLRIYRSFPLKETENV